MAVLKTIQHDPSAPISPCEIFKKETVKEAVLLPRKRVSFALNRNKEYANSTMTEDDCRTLWHTPYDFKKMKEHTNTFAKQAMKQDKARSDDQKSYSNIILRVYDQCCKVESEPQCNVLSNEDSRDLVYLVGKANSRTGLERVIVRDLAYDKRYRRNEIVRAVLKIQRQSINPDVINGPVNELMHLACETISRPSRLFARQLAQALEETLR